MSHPEPVQPFGAAQDSPAVDSPKKSPLGKFKDKAKKLRTKIKKPKSPGAAETNGTSSSSSSEEESGSDQQIGARPGADREVGAVPGLKGESYEVIPDPKVSEGVKGPRSTGVEEKLGGLNLKDDIKPDAHAPHAPVHEGKTAKGEDLISSQEPTDEDKELKKKAAEGAAAAAVAGAAGVDVHSFAESGDGKKEGNVPGENKSYLEQAKERIFGSSTKREGGEPLETGEGKSSPTVTDRATGIKDTIAAKFGYGGSNKDLTGDADPANKSVLQKAQETAVGTKDTLASKLDSGGKPLEEKTYTQRAYDAATGAKDAVAEKVGYGGAAATTPTGDQKSYTQKAQETAVGAKDAVAAKLGYTGEGGNAPASTAERFHPGEEDVALSQLITEKISTGATTVRDTILRPFGGSGPPTPTTTPPPSTAHAVAADPAHNIVSGAEGH